MSITSKVKCKIWGFHSGEYEECRLLGYKNPVLTSQKTHYVSATEPIQSILCTFWGFRGGNYEECRLLEYKDPVPTSQFASVASWASVVLTSPIRVTLMKEALRSSETSVLTRATRRNISEDAILLSHSFTSKYSHHIFLKKIPVYCLLLRNCIK
jgi:hypothetical protein